MKSFFLLILTLISSVLYGQQLTSKEYQEDFAYFWKTINDNYAYFDKKHTDWKQVKAQYEKSLDTISSKRSFTTFLEAALRELYDDHASLNTNTPYSRRLVPSGTDIWAAFNQNKPLITDVRTSFGAEKAGITAGMEIVAINDTPVAKAIAPFLSTTLTGNDPEARNYALRVALAGNHVQPRKLTLFHTNKTSDFYPDQPQMLLENISYASLITSNKKDNIGYIKINDCLYNNDLIPAFDSVMQTMKGTRGLILDLRETPSGGNTTVARAILGWFINKDQFYQKHEWPAEEKEYGIKRSWVEIASPRKGKYYSLPLVVLAGHWTGSVGEGLTIGFDGMKRATVIGTQMAGLNGAIYSYQLPHSRIGFSIPAEKLYHVNGKPREHYLPAIVVDLLSHPPLSGSDPVLEKAHTWLNQTRKK